MQTQSQNQIAEYIEGVKSGIENGEYTLEDILDIEILTDLFGSTKQINCIITIGGPYAELQFKGSKSAVLFGRWGSGEFSTSCDLSNYQDLISYLEEIWQD